MPYATPLTSPTVTIPFASTSTTTSISHPASHPASTSNPNPNSTSNPNSTTSSPDRPYLNKSPFSSSSFSSSSSSTTSTTSRTNYSSSSTSSSSSSIASPAMITPLSATLPMFESMAVGVAKVRGQDDDWESPREESVGMFENGNGNGVEKGINKGEKKRVEDDDGLPVKGMNDLNLQHGMGAGRGGKGQAESSDSLVDGESQSNGDQNTGVEKKVREGSDSSEVTMMNGTTGSGNGGGKLSISEMREAYYGKSPTMGSSALKLEGLPPVSPSPMHRFLDSLIVVQPPTPDRGPGQAVSNASATSPGGDDVTPTPSRTPTPTSAAITNPSSTMTSSSVSSTDTITPAASSSSQTATRSQGQGQGHQRTGSGNLHNLAVYQQVLPQVRSPPRPVPNLGLGIDSRIEEDGRGGSMLSDASSSASTVVPFDHNDSLQLSQKRGRRARLFGFTEMSPDSGSSSASNSRDGSRDSSPSGSHVHRGGLEITSIRYGRRDNNRSGSTTPDGTQSPPMPGARSPLGGSDPYNVSAPSTPASAPQQSMPRRHPASRNGSSTFIAKSVRPTPVSPRPAALSTRTSAQRNEGALKLDLDSIRSTQQSTSQINSPGGTPGILLRKKSGELVKPSLKSSSSYSDVTELGPPSTRSLPSTPSLPKYVHFDTQLEKVKLFLHDQKPQIVSRDGSPNEYYTTSEGEEYPFPNTDDDTETQKKTQLEIQLPNFPISQPPDADLYLESLFLDEDRKTLRGIVRVRNISFQKWVAIRFTFDWWQTTSEVTGTHKESISGGQFDRFQFSIKLHDILAKIEEKTLFIALRFNTEGREIWDNNNGSNYQVSFSRVPVPVKRTVAARPSVSQGNGLISPGMGKSIGGRSSQWDPSGARQDRMKDLREKLRMLSKGDDQVISPPDTTKRPPLGSPSRSRIGSYGAKKFTEQQGHLQLDIGRARESPSAGITSPLAARYDFGASLQNSRGTKGSSPSGRRRDLPSDNDNGQTASSPGPTMEFYSPQIPIADLPESSKNNYAVKEVPAFQNRLEMPPPDLRIQEPSPPMDYFTNGAPSAVIAPITESGPPTVTSLPREYSAPPIQMAEFRNGQDSRAAVQDEEASPPSITSSIESNSDTESPMSPESERSPPQWTPHKTMSLDDFGKLSYSSILEQFCWAGSPQLSSLGDQRTSSSSSVDRLYSDPFSGYTRSTQSGSGYSTPSASEMTPTNTGHGQGFQSQYRSTSANPMTIESATRGRTSGSCTPSPSQTPIASPTQTLRTCTA